ncbi:hypothetical protein FB567DRAFT_514572 [Paraphoma chrysanthemicola]|uniref:Uncharacterized protein n=1 Tax=Paraphoma chrysanthemicola TaxID=798071 RepID=A0A8K0W3U6_9PLEO|nr:hypothetical protein FB567DRAFT_514572 [Paraphoma chrysanthemicola]
MAFRGRTPNMSDAMDRSYDSSPDPLAISLNENNTRTARKSSPRKALVSTSPSKQNRRPSITEMDFMSPSKAMIMNTPRMGSASPWRIKVTVQAEPGSDDENGGSPSVKRVTRTQTTTVPLKDPDAPSSPVKRGRGRPRKSDIGAVSKPKRVGTPAKRTARSRSREPSVGAAEASAADVDTDAPPKRKRGRPRKNKQPAVEDENMMAVQDLDRDLSPFSEATPEPTARPTPSTSHKSIRFASPKAPTPAIETTDTTPQQPTSMLPQDKKQNGARLGVPADRRRRKLMADYELPIVDTPPRTELGDRLRARKGTPHAKKIAPVSISSDEESDRDSNILTPTSGEEDVVANEAGQDLFNTRAGASEPDRYSSPSSDSAQSDMITSPADHAPTPPDQSSDDGEEMQDATNFVFDEGTTRMPDDTTVIDSENFSMISVDSLPSSGGLTSPAQPPDVSIVSAPRTGSKLRNEYLVPAAQTVSQPTPRTAPKISPVPTQTLSGLKPADGLLRPALRRYITPITNPTAPTAPPVIEPAPIAPPKTETPRLGRVVTAGVALQGVLDPSRLTPEPSQKMLDEKRERLDDLFRGFSEGTRRELQAGLRLGEQLAQNHNKEESPLARTAPDKSSAGPAPKEGVFKTHRKAQQPRLLTPEDQEADTVAPAPESVMGEVQYPSLDVAATEKSLPSPAESEDGDEMSWQVDTPPAVTGNTERMRAVIITDRTEEIHVASAAATSSGAATTAQQEDYSDIWQEEASRSSNTADTDEAPQVQDLFEPGVIPPARAKLPRTWRRKSGNHFQYSDEAESPPQPHEAAIDPAANVPEVVVEDAPEAEEDEEDSHSDDSDDTGMFFQSNMPSIFNKRRSRDLKNRKADKLDLTLLLNEGASLVPESSPPMATKKASSATKTNPFLNTPPRFPGFPSSPQKSSPLRRELHNSDISSASPSRVLDESSLPLPQSSPFHTLVDGQSMLSVASDQRQLQMEMEGVTDSSIRQVRNEANEYLDAYEPQERSLDEIEEVTEPSRTWHRNTSLIEPSLPQIKMLSPVRKRVPLFRDTPEKPRFALHREPKSPVVDEEMQNTESTASSSAAEERILTPPAEQQRPIGLLTRMTSSLWSAVTRPAIATASSSTPPAPHPILAKLTPLPKIEPWTKTHYKTLDRLYQINQKHPALFSPSISPATPLSQTNAHLLKEFLSANKQPYVGAVFSAWGYEFDMSEELVVLCQVFCELMTLEDIEAYEALKGREIELGECLPGSTGELIDGEEVARRLATVILGEEVRADERQGIDIDRRKGLEVVWPQ